MRSLAIIFVIASLVISCDNTRESSGLTSNPSEPANHSGDFPKSEKVEMDPALVSEYSNILQEGDSFEKKVAEKIIENIQLFKEKPLKDYIVTVGNIDGTESLDTILSIIWVENDTVYLNSKWYRKSELLWEENLVNPYMYVSDNQLFKYETSPVWTRFTIARDFAIPEFSKVSEYENIPLELVVSSGISKFNDYGINVSKADYIAYLENRSVDLLTHGDPELNILSIWYEPAKMFVPYYQP